MADQENDGHKASENTAPSISDAAATEVSSNKMQAEQKDQDGHQAPHNGHNGDNGSSSAIATATSPPPPAAAAAAGGSTSGASPQPIASTSRLSPSSPPPTTATTTANGAVAPAPAAGQKRQRRSAADGDAAAAGRGKRMFGLLNATLGKAKKEAEDRVGLAKRRAEIVSRQQERLEQQRSELLHEENLKKTLRREYEREYKLLEAIVGGDAAFKSMRAQKRRLASFLVTTSSSDGDATAARSRGLKSNAGYVAPAPAPRVPSSLAPSTKSYPVYFLPRKLTLEQEDLLDDQEDEVDAVIDDAEKAWEERKRGLNEQLEEVRRGVGEIKRRDAEEQGGVVGKGQRGGRRRSSTSASRSGRDEAASDRRSRLDSPQETAMQVDSR